MTTSWRPRNGDVVLVEQGIGVVRFVGNVDFDQETHIGIELKGEAITNGMDGSLNGVQYFQTPPKHGLLVRIERILRTLTSEEILKKLAILHDIVTGRASSAHFISYSRYSALLREKEHLQQTLEEQKRVIQTLKRQNEALEAIKNSSASNDASQDTDIATETQPMLYSDERDDDELAEPQPQTSSNHIRQEHEHKQTDEDDAVDTTQMDPDTDDDDDEDDIEDPQPSTATRPTSMDELLTRTFQCVQSAVATQAGTSKGQAKTNQDSVIRMDAFGPSSAFQLYGVCDGHGPNGHDISQFVTEHLPAILHDHLTQQLSTLSIQQILQTTFASIDKKLQTQRALPFDINYSGTTATIGLFAGDVLYVANIGDSRTVLGQTPPSTVTKKKHVPVAVALSVDHDPKNRTEQSRILQKCQKSKSVTIVHDDEDESARIQIELPVLNETHPANGKTASPTSNPFLAAQNVNKNAAAAEEEDADAKPASFVRRISASVSRSLGDRMAHEYGGLISEPEVTVHRLCPQDVFVIFASDGIWQMIDNDDVMRSMGTKLQQHKNDVVYDDLESATQKLVREANIMWQDEFEDYTDDISCVIARVGQIKE